MRPPAQRAARARSAARTPGRRAARRLRRPQRPCRAASGTPGAGARESGWRGTAARRRARRTARSACGPGRPGAGWSTPACAPGMRATRSSTRSSKRRSSREGGWIEIMASRSGQLRAARDGHARPARRCAPAGRRSRRAPGSARSATSQTSTRSSRMRRSQRASESAPGRGSGAAWPRVGLVQQAVEPGAEFGAHQLLAGARAEHDADRLAHALREVGAGELAVVRRAATAAASRSADAGRGMQFIAALPPPSSGTECRS